MGWLSRDGRVLILASTLRSLGQGFISVTLGVYLATAGLSLVQIGAYFSAGAAGAAFFALAVALASERVGRRRLLVLFTLTTGTGAAALVLTDNMVVLVIFAFVGAMSGTPGGITEPTQPLVQANLAEAAPAPRRTDTFATLRIATTFARAIGALAAGLPPALQAVFGLDELASFKVMFAAFVALLLAIAGLYASLSPPTDAGQATRKWTNPLRLKSRRTIFTLTALFSVDTFGGALLIQSLVAYWFKARFDLDLGVISLVFFSSEVLTAISLWLAARLASRIGLINTMVFTHIPASLFLLGAAFAPAAWIAVVFWQLRAFFSQMDVPARDSYTMAIVGPEERVAMASIHSLGRGVASMAGPSTATALWSALSASAPFVACSVIKISYDVSLWLMFRHVKPPEEVLRARAHLGQAGAQQR